VSAAGAAIKTRAKSTPRSGVNNVSTARRAHYPDAGMHFVRLVAAFARKHLIHVDGELPPNGVAFEAIEFAGFQLENIIKPIFANVDRRGRRLVKKVLIGLPRDGAKSEIASVIILAIAFLWPKYKGQYYFIARNKEQARAVFDKVRTMVLHDPMLRRACEVQADKIIIKETKAFFQVLPGDEKSVQSKHADVVVVDEYHVHKNDHVLNAMTSGMVGNWDSQALVIVLSTAGPVRKGPLWDLIAKWKTDKSAHVYWCGADDGDDANDPKVWRKANPMPWISDAALVEAHKQPPWDFERYHLNRFPSTGKMVAFDAKSWDALSGLPVIDPDTPSFLGADASFSRDTTALVLDQVDADGFHNWVAWIIKSEDGEPIDRQLVMATTLEIVQTYNIERMACDPNYFVLEMLELANSHGVPVEVYRQTAEKMARAYDIMWAVVQSGRANHGGAKPLREHVLNAGQEPTAYGPRLTKVEESKKIDAAVACAIVTAVAELEYQEGAAGPQIVVF
jgi:phage terminase large subunit-like protein